MDLPLAPPQPNMVSSSGIRSSIQKARATDMVRDQVLKNLRAAEGGSTVDAGVELHRKSIGTALGGQLAAGTALADVVLTDIQTSVATLLDTNYDADFFRIAWEKHTQAGMHSIA